MPYAAFLTNEQGRPFQNGFFLTEPGQRKDAEKVGSKENEEYRKQKPLLRLSMCFDNTRSRPYFHQKSIPEPTFSAKFHLPSYPLFCCDRENVPQSLSAS